MKTKNGIQKIGTSMKKTIYLVLCVFFNSINAVAQVATSETKTIFSTGLINDIWTWSRTICLFALLVTIIVSGIKVYGKLSGNSQGEEAERSMWGWVKGLFFIIFVLGVITALKALFNSSVSNTLGSL